MIKVFDLENKTFRDINDECNIDVNGLVFFERAAISIIEYYYLICGYFFFNKENRNIIPIDIQNDLIVLDEYAFNDMSSECKKKLEKYNLTKCSRQMFSYPYFCLWYKEDIISIDNTDYFTCFCKKILNDVSLINKFILMNESVYFPNTNSELYRFAQVLYKFTDFNYINNDFELGFKYIIDSLIKGYHINMNENDINKYAYHISHFAYKKLEEYNA